MNTGSFGPWAATSLLLVACLPCFAIQDGATMSRQAADARHQLSSIDYRHFRNLDDYLSRCDHVRALIPTLESFYKWSDAELQRLRIKHSDNPHLLDLADFYVSLNSEDKAGLYILRQEMDLAAEMSNIPSPKRQSFFDEKILPLQQKEDQLSDREIKMARDGEKRGLTLPPWVSERLTEAK